MPIKAMQHLENQGCYKLRKMVEWYKIPLSPQRKRKSAMASFYPVRSA